MTHNAAFVRQGSPPLQSIPERFEEIVAREPDRLAVKFEKSPLSYRELNEASNRIGRALLAFELPEWASVALLFGRGINAIVALIGALKAGKQAHTLDARAPEERMKAVLDDCRTCLIVTDGEFLAVAQGMAGDVRSVFNIDEIDRSLASNNLGLTIAPKRSATIAYTSGSTGQPRGIVRTHERTVSAAILGGNYRRIGAEDKVSLLHSITFSSGESDLFMALLNGAAILPFDFTCAGGVGLANWLKDERVTILHSPPAAFRELARVNFPASDFSDLRRIRLSGAPITRGDFDFYKSKFARGTLLEIGMGSTEIGFICNAVVDHDFSFPQEGSPVGYAREGREVLILSDEGQELGPGKVGEIAIRSRQFTRGNLRRLGLPQEKFHCDPQDETALIYRTGDLGTRLADGFVIHRGRKDLIVKIRGFRVDISAVEQALLEHPDIKEAGVRAWDREEGEKYLAGYIVPRPESVLNASEVREFLSNKLPDYMIPTAFKVVESLPLTNGKLDRLALPQPDTRRPELKETYVAPRNDVERKLGAIWSEVLQIENIGVHDNFFDLGGHSLTASRVLSRVREWLGVEVSLVSLFESPTVTGLAPKVENVLHASGRANPPLVAFPRCGNLPASFSQRALWFHDQLEPGSCAYNLVPSYQLRGELDAQIMEQSINQIIARHEVLRSVFETVDGQPVQNILSTTAIRLEVIDLSDVTTKSLQDAEVRRFVGMLAEQSFDLARGPLLRPVLLRLGSNEHVFLLAIHHIVFDGWSTGVFFRELSEIYNSLRSGKPCPPPKLCIQYADFAIWQRQRLRDANLEEHLSYWRNQLDHLSILKFPFKRSQPAADSSSSVREAFELSGDLLNGLRRLTDRSGTTLFMVLLAAWKVALHRYTGQTDIAIGTFVSGRNHPAVEDLIGYFLNLLVLRSDLSGDPTFRELLERIRQVCIAAFAHQDLPFEKLVEEMQPTRYVPNRPLVQATFALQNTPQQSLNLTGIAARDLDIDAGVARPFDLHLYVIEEKTRLRGYVCYNTNLFEDETIKRLINHFTNILGAIVVDEEQRISALPMLTEQEKHQLLVNWNDTKAEYPINKCIHELVEIQAEKTPDAVAVIFGNQEVTYGELNRRANQLAHYLRRHSVRPDELVALFIERSAVMVIAILGVVKAGGAYLPIDPALPAERIRFILKEAKVNLVLTQEKRHAVAFEFRGDAFCLDIDRSKRPHQDRVPIALDPKSSEDIAEKPDQQRRSPLLEMPIKKICLDTDWDLIARESEANPENSTTADNLAYVIYTSGSSGLPKGAQITHANLLNLVLWHHQTFSISASDRATQIAGPGFDAAVWELWPYLTMGASIHIPDEVTRLDPASLQEWLLARAITISFVPTALAESLLTLDWPQQTALRILLTGGDTLNTYPPEQLPFKLFNNYGPTECTVVATSGQIVSNRDGAHRPTIGRPISNTQICILDSQLQPVPIGVAGELHIGGAGLARGYLNRPDLTAEKFIPNPFSSEVGARLYKTGDRARYREDGNIEFLGRTDDQVKIRGYRIEVGEIEAELGQHPSVRESVVLARADNSGDKRLVAYVVGDGTKLDELRSYLKRKFPQYMVPSTFVLLDALLGSGKQPDGTYAFSLTGPVTSPMPMPTNK